jgi:hypothetical protein
MKFGKHYRIKTQILVTDFIKIEGTRRYYNGPKASKNLLEKATIKLTLIPMHIDTGITQTS